MGNVDPQLIAAMKAKGVSLPGDDGVDPDLIAAMKAKGVPIPGASSSSPGFVTNEYGEESPSAPPLPPVYNYKVAAVNTSEPDTSPAYDPSKHTVVQNFGHNVGAFVGQAVEGVVTPQGRAQVALGSHVAGQEIADIGNFVKEGITSPWGRGHETYRQPGDAARNQRAADFYDAFGQMVIGSQGGADAAPWDALRAANAAKAGDKDTAMKLLRGMPGRLGQWAHDNPDILLQDLAPMVHGAVERFGLATESTPMSRTVGQRGAAAGSTDLRIEPGPDSPGLATPNRNWVSTRSTVDPALEAVVSGAKKSPVATALAANASGVRNAGHENGAASVERLSVAGASTEAVPESLWRGTRVGPVADSHAGVDPELLQAMAQKGVAPPEDHAVPVASPPAPVDLDALENHAGAKLLARMKAREVASGGQASQGDALGSGSIAPSALESVPPRLVQDMPAGDIHTDPERFQYKILSGKGGQTGSLSGVQSWDPEYAGVLHVWKDPENGLTYAVNGHNRKALADRLGVPTLDVSYLTADTAAEARRKGALINIAEGQGNALDAAKLFRDGNDTPESLARQNIPMGREVARQGMAISNLGTPLFNMAVRGEMPVERAAIIGEKLPSPADQQTLMQRIEQAQKGGKTVTNGVIGQMADRIASGPKVTETTIGLFGPEENIRSTEVERAEIADFIDQSLGSEGSAFRNAAKNKGRLEKGNNSIDADQAMSIADQNARGKQIFAAMKNTPGTVSDILNEAASRYAAGKENPNDIKQDALNRFQAALPGVLQDELGPTAPEGADAGAGHGVPDLFDAQEGVRGSAPAVDDGGRLSRLAAKADQVAEAAVKRIRANNKGKLLSGIDPEDLKSAAVYVAAKLAKGTLTAASYTAHMVETFGEWIRPHLDTIWQAARDVHRQLTQGQPPAGESQALAPSAPRGGEVPPGAQSAAHVQGEASGNPEASSLESGAPPVKPKRVPPPMARSINLDKLSDPELVQHYKDWADAHGKEGQEPLTPADVKRQSRALGLTVKVLNRLPVGFKPNNVHFGIWQDAVRDASDAAGKSYGVAKRAFEKRPTDGNRAALEAATEVRDKAAARRSALAREWGQTGQVLKNPSDPFAARRQGDMFRNAGKERPLGKSSALKRLDSRKPEDFVHFTVEDTNAAIDRLNERFRNVKATDIGDCLS